MPYNSGQRSALASAYALDVIQKLRRDISDYVVHWTKEPNAFGTLETILSEKRLLAGTSERKGNIPTICFTETPIEEFHRIRSRYSPFGVAVSKRWIYSQGARPVIYQTDSEYYSLPNSLKWRHVRYEPNGERIYDFTWEREWRIPTQELFLDPTSFFALVPDEYSMNSILHNHTSAENWRIYGDSIAYGEEWLYQNPRPFEYRIRINRV